MKDLTTPPPAVATVPPVVTPPPATTPPPTAAAAPVGVSAPAQAAPVGVPAPAQASTAPSALSFPGSAAGPTAAQRVEAVAASWTANYNVPGQTQPVRARTAFRMIGSASQVSSEVAQTRIRTKLGAKLPADLAARLPAITSGRGTPDEVRRLTQLLIDAGGLDLPEVNRPQMGRAEVTTEMRIRRMQWEFGLGTDCQGSLRPIIAELRGGSAGNWGDDLVLTDVAGNPTQGSQDRFRTVARADGRGIADAQPGDVMKWNAAHGPGHYVMVQESHAVAAGSEEAQRLGATGPGIQGPLQVMRVFASWGGDGNPDNPDGGVRDETWVCDTGKNPPRWGVVGDDGQLGWGHGAPNSHTLQGIYRPKRVGT